MVQKLYGEFDSIQTLTKNMERTVIQCNMFSAMLAVDNYHFLDEMCKLLVRVRGTTNILDKIAYDKLVELIWKVEKKKVREFLLDNNIKYLCT